MLLESGHLLESTEEILSNYQDLDIRTVKSYTMEVGPGHPWYFQKPCLIDFKDKQVSREEHNGSAQHPLPPQGDALPSLTYVLL